MNVIRIDPVIYQRIMTAPWRWSARHFSLESCVHQIRLIWKITSVNVNIQIFFPSVFEPPRGKTDSSQLMWWERGSRSAACLSASGLPRLTGRSALWGRDSRLHMGRVCVSDRVGNSYFLRPCAGPSGSFILISHSECWTAEKIWGALMWCARHLFYHTMHTFKSLYFLPAEFVIFFWV